jgi:hypothetical protein
VYWRDSMLIRARSHRGGELAGSMECASPVVMPIMSVLCVGSLSGCDSNSRTVPHESAYRPSSPSVHKRTFVICAPRAMNPAPAYGLPIRLGTATPEKAGRLCNACKTTDDKLTVWTLLDTGLRVFELCALTQATSSGSRSRCASAAKVGLRASARRKGRADVAPDTGVTGALLRPQ